MNTSSNTHPRLWHTSAGIGLSQVFVAPTFDYKLDEKHAFGISPIFAIQQFRAQGLQDFGVGNHGYDYSYGGGVRIGYTGKLTDWLAVGAGAEPDLCHGAFQRLRQSLCRARQF